MTLNALEINATFGHADNFYNSYHFSILSDQCHMKVTIFLILNYALENRKYISQNSTCLKGPEIASGILMIMAPGDVSKIGLCEWS